MTTRQDFRKLAIQSLEIPGNQKCFDCGAPQPMWSSCKLGIFICLNCAGRHRSYGVGISFVRSADLDRWSEEQAGFALAGGNKKFDDFLKQKKVSKPVQYQRTDLESVLEEYRQILIDEARQPAIRKIIENFKKDLPVELPDQSQSVPSQSTPQQKEKSEKIVERQTEQQEVKPKKGAFQMAENFQEPVEETQPKEHIEEKTAEKPVQKITKKVVKEDEEEISVPKSTLSSASNKGGRRGLGKIIKIE
ncbi:GTPase_activating protein for ARF [Hexamita inflata]|uniref:GTPase activating protein for ARF n=1 Tax=Hexamita inflata TaxID=28002 RepID=A0AA86UUE9_9EUKA|nr:GTPase activating protein for ARF [Hexamita inflata]